MKLENDCFSCTCIISQLDLPHGQYGCSSPSTKGFHGWTQPCFRVCVSNPKTNYRESHYWQNCRTDDQIFFAGKIVSMNLLSPQETELEMFIFLFRLKEWWTVHPRKRTQRNYSQISFYDSSDLLFTHSSFQIIKHLCYFNVLRISV